MAELREHLTGERKADYFIECQVQDDTRMRWCHLGRRASGRRFKTKTFVKLDGVRIPKGYYNYLSEQVELLPEQGLLSRV